MNIHWLNIPRQNLAATSTSPTMSASTSTRSVVTAKEYQDEDTAESQQGTSVPFSSFTNVSKYLITIMASIASLISPMSSNIYLTALNPIAEDLHVSDSMVNLTITTYMVC
jgi:expansin (peptidoglycan-binding protein)